MTRIRTWLGYAFLLIALAACGSQPKLKPIEGLEITFSNEGAVIDKGGIACVTANKLETKNGDVEVGQAIKATTNVTITFGTGWSDDNIQGTYTILDCPTELIADATITPPTTVAPDTSSSGAASANPTTTDTTRSAPPASGGSGTEVGTCPNITDVKGKPVELKALYGVKAQVAVNAAHPWIMPNAMGLHTVRYDVSYVAGDEVPAGAATLHGCNIGEAAKPTDTDGDEVKSKDDMKALPFIASWTDHEPVSNGINIKFKADVTEVKLPIGVEMDYNGHKYVPGETIPIETERGATLWFVGKN